MKARWYYGTCSCGNTECHMTTDGRHNYISRACSVCHKVQLWKKCMTTKDQPFTDPDFEPMPVGQDWVVINPAWEFLMPGYKKEVVFSDDISDACIQMHLTWAQDIPKIESTHGKLGLKLVSLAYVAESFQRELKTQ